MLQQWPLRYLQLLIEPRNVEKSLRKPLLEGIRFPSETDAMQACNKHLESNHLLFFISFTFSRCPLLSLFFFFSLWLSSPWHKSRNYFCVKDLINFICETCHPEKDSILCDSLRDKSLSDGEHNVRKRHLYEFPWWCGIFPWHSVKSGIRERKNYNL